MRVGSYRVVVVWMGSSPDQPIPVSWQVVYSRLMARMYKRFDIGLMAYLHGTGVSFDNSLDGAIRLLGCCVESLLES